MVVEVARPRHDQADVDSGELSNTAEATGTDPNGDTDTDQTQVPGTREAGYTFARDAQLDDADGDGLADAGDEIAYSFSVTTPATSPSPMSAWPTRC